MIINFIKMHGLGNDFIIIDVTADSLKLTQEQIKFLCNRRLGIGCDQLILTESLIPQQTIRITIFNADGSSASACGNATRCVAYYALKKYQINNINIKTNNRTMAAHIKKNGNILVNMGYPSFNSEDIPLSNLLLDPTNLTFKDLSIKETGIAVNVGNPHIVFLVEDFDNINLESLGPKIENHSYFPHKINVEFIKIINKNTLQMKVWERGTGITTACGTGAVASFAVARRLNLINHEPTKIILDGGKLILYSNKDDSIMIEGPATMVYEGRIELTL